MPATSTVIHSAVLALVLALAAAATDTTQQSMPPSTGRPLAGRLTVAVLWFADETGDPQMSHWRYAVSGLLAGQLREVKAVRVLPTGAVDYAFRQLVVKKGSPLDVVQVLKMGEFYAAQQQWDEARNVLESVLELEPDGWEVYLWRGIFADHDGDLSTAADYLWKALELNQESGFAHFGLGNLFGRQGKLKAAREELRACLRYALDADSADKARKMIAQINEQIGIEDNLSQTNGGVD